jgi:hypothetical protein
MKEIILKLIEAFSRKGEGFFYAGLPFFSAKCKLSLDIP